MKINFRPCTVILSIMFTPAFAQKSPQLQQTGVRAPQTVKIDGKLTEWANMPWAYNDANRIYYLLANDDKNLYLSIRGIDEHVISKVLNGGIKFTVSHTLDKKVRAKDADNATVVFPLGLRNDVMVNTMMPLISLREFKHDTLKNRRQIDSINNIANRLLTSALKEIGVKGLTGITQSVLPIYNDNDIVVAARFIADQPIFELAIPLKYLRLDFAGAKSFSYNIKLDLPEVDPNVPHEDIPTEKIAKWSVPATAAPEKGRSGAPDPDVAYIYNATDLWGEYTLVEK